MNTIKRTLSVFIIITIIASLFSCSKPQPQQEQTSAAITITESTVAETEAAPEKISYTFDKESCTLTIDGSKARTLTRAAYDKITANLSNTNLVAETVILTEGFEEIGTNTFSDNSGLKKVVLPASLSAIGRSAFFGCDSLVNIVVNPQSQHFMTDKTGVLYTKDMTNLIVYPPALSQEKYTVPETVTSIYSNAFYRCPNLRELHMSPNFSGEFTHCFYCCDNLENVTFPASSLSYYCDEQGLIYKNDTKEIVFVPADIRTLEFPENADSFFYDAMINNELITEIILTSSTVDIEEYLFQFTNLEKITIDGTNPNYSCLDGVLYNKEQSALLWYPPMKDGKTFEVPDTVERINFIRGKWLERIIIPDSVKVIDDSAFYGCDSLKYVYIGKGLEKFDYNDEFSVEQENIFSLCKNLQKIIVDSGNKNFAIDKYGALCTADMKNIITLPANGNAKKYVINDKVTHILSCFKNCSNFEKLHIGSNVEYVNIGEEGTESIIGFAGCVSLEEITVSEKNEYYTSIDGILYSKDKTELCLYPAGKQGEDFVIPESVDRVGDFAFLDNQNLKRLHMGKITTFNLVFDATDYQPPIDIYFACKKDDLPSYSLKDHPRIHFEANKLPEN